MSNILFPKLVNEGYCCMHGYLGLCKARKETPVSMAKFFSIHPWAIRYHYRQQKLGRHKCQNHPDCLKGVILDLGNEKAS